ncbi:conserved hypothetical protein [uncultured Desulfatiglans sp.]|uniref:Uncharacterized protein n=1 Tax=Uncultured Desulfatiglans sp. TaxID=1748965 RepID=A0A653AGM9_UNCDX|nr:conserved hypothetical protein [uncultured Desulfatiglans sp.]
MILAEGQHSPFQNLLPREPHSLGMQIQVARWLRDKKIPFEEQTDHLVVQLGFSAVAVFCYRVMLPSRSCVCITLQAYILGPVGASFLEDEEINELNRNLMAGKLLRLQEEQVLLADHFLAEGLSEDVFLRRLDLFRRGIHFIDNRIARRLS